MSENSTPWNKQILIANKLIRNSDKLEKKKSESGLHNQTTQNLEMQMDLEI